ncbi:hypothetical protein JCM19045_2559 [Bacillus sp. JCM 19045]|nr:hypothetical protein JCM19045_2559 [Bacillus sp. JCM 19045]
MTLPALSQWNAFMLETLLAKGMTEEKLLLHVENHDAEALNSFDQTFDYSDLIEATTEDPSLIKSAIESGYQVKFMSTFGIKRLLLLKYGIEDGADYTMGEARFDGLHLSETQLHEFGAMLSPNWKLFSEKKQDNYGVTIVHATEVN